MQMFFILFIYFSCKSPLNRESEQYCALANYQALVIDRYSQSQDRLLQRGYEVDRR
jgi:hypothetical protein